MKGSTKPSALLSVGSLSALELGWHLGGWWWLFLVAFFLAIVFDAYRVTLHEEAHRCSDD